MKTQNRSIQNIALVGLFFLLSACAPAAAPAPVEEATSALLSAAPTDVPTLAPAATEAAFGDGGYQPVSPEVCQILQEGATQSLGLSFTMEEGMPFIDYLNNETGWSCTLISETNGAFISDPNDALAKLVAGFIGWEEQTAYAAGGPTGAATAMTRDSGLLLISVSWEPSADISCPADQPISDCPMPPEKKLYTVKIEAAQK